MGKIGLVFIALVVAGCGPTGPNSGSTASPSAAASSSPPALLWSPEAPATAASSTSPSPSPPSAFDFSKAKPAALDGAIKQTGATYLEGDVDILTACPSTATKCLTIQSQMNGTNASYFRALLGNSHGSVACYIYTIHDSNAWHFLDMVCAHQESNAMWPDVGASDNVFIAGGGCANVRATPGLSGKIVACFPANTTVNIDGGPDYVVEPQQPGQPVVSHVWWHIQATGWMAHDFLVPS